MAEIVFLLLLLGSFAGFFAGLLGIGGGLIVVPGLLFLLKDIIPEVGLMHSAIATALTIAVFTTAASAWSHYKHNAVDIFFFKKLTPFVILGVFSGVTIIQFLSFDFLRIFFAIFEMSIAFIMFFNISTKKHIHHMQNWIFNTIGYIIGLFSSILGINGGTMSTPFLTYNNINIKNAIATSACVGVPIAIFGSLSFFIAQSQLEKQIISLEALFWVACSSVFFAPIGAKVAHKINNKKLKKIFALFLMVVASLVFFKF